MSSDKVFCPAPFVSQVIWANGKIGVCCNDIGIIVENAAIEFTHQRRKQIQDSFKNNIVPDICKKCYDKFLLAKQSTVSVYRDIYGDVYSKSLEIEKPNYIHFSPSNKCNLACKICTGINSDMFGRVYNDIDLSSSLLKNDMDFYLKYFDDNIENIINFTFHGGEPIRDEHFPDLVKILRKNENISITLITNGTSLKCKNEDVIDLIKPFKNLRIMLSMESVKEVNDYIRRFTDTEEVIKNFNTYAEKLPHAKMVIHSVITNLSLLYLHKFLLMLLNKKNINRLDGWSYFILDYPKSYRVENLSNEHRKKIINNLFNKDIASKIENSVFKMAYYSLKSELSIRWEKNEYKMEHWNNFLKESREFDSKSLIATDSLTNLLLNA